MNKYFNLINNCFYIFVNLLDFLFDAFNTDDLIKN